jgi:hypothetical protein
MTAPSELAGWSLPPGDPTLIILVIDDSEDDPFVREIARPDPDRRSQGQWGSGVRDDHPGLSFHLQERLAAAPATMAIRSPPPGFDRQWYTRLVSPELLAAVRRVPHRVALMPAEIAGDATGDELLSRLGGALIVEVTKSSTQVDLRYPPAR